MSPSFPFLPSTNFLPLFFPTLSFSLSSPSPSVPAVLSPKINIWVMWPLANLPVMQWLVSGYYCDEHLYMKDTKKHKVSYCNPKQFTNCVTAWSNQQQLLFSVYVSMLWYCRLVESCSVFHGPCSVHIASRSRHGRCLCLCRRVWREHEDPRSGNGPHWYCRYVLLLASIAVQWLPTISVVQVEQSIRCVWGMYGQ